MRSLFGEYRLFGIWLVTAALMMKLVVPAGYMAMVSAGSISIKLCSGFAPVRTAAPMAGMARHGEANAEPMLGMKHGGDGESDDPQTKQPCPFATLASTPLTPDLGSSDLAIVLIPRETPTARPLTIAPGRGMAAPPPPSHAPPPRRV